MKFVGLQIILQNDRLLSFFYNYFTSLFIHPKKVSTEDLRCAHVRDNKHDMFPLFHPWFLFLWQRFSGPGLHLCCFEERTEIRIKISYHPRAGKRKQVQSESKSEYFMISWFCLTCWPLEINWHRSICRQITFALNCFTWHCLQTITSRCFDFVYKMNVCILLRPTM